MQRRSANEQLPAHRRVAQGMRQEPSNEDQFSVQLGVDLEEFIEGLACIELDLPADAMNEASAAIALLADVAVLLKRGAAKARIVEGKRAEFLDALCDREVTGNGLAFLAGFDKDGADEAVINSNDAKLVDGKPSSRPAEKS